MMKIELGLKVLGRKTSSNSIVIQINSSTYFESITYRKVDVERLDQPSLKAFLQMTHTKDVNVVDIGTYLGYNYKENNPIFVDKSTGLLYAQDTTHDYCREAIILLQKLNRFKLVEGFKRKQWHKGHIANIQGWIESNDKENIQGPKRETTSLPRES